MPITFTKTKQLPWQHREGTDSFHLHLHLFSFANELWYSTENPFSLFLFFVSFSPILSSLRYIVHHLAKMLLSGRKSLTRSFFWGCLCRWMCFGGVDGWCRGVQSWEGVFLFSCFKASLVDKWWGWGIFSIELSNMNIEDLWEDVCRYTWERIIKPNWRSWTSPRITSSSSSGSSSMMQPHARRYQTA